MNFLSFQNSSDCISVSLHQTEIKHTLLMPYRADCVCAVLTCLVVLVLIGKDRLVRWTIILSVQILEIPTLEHRYFWCVL